MAHFPKDESEEGDFDSVSALMRYEANELDESETLKPIPSRAARPR